MTHSPQKPKSSAAYAMEQLRERIFSGALGAGTDHLESELAAELGLSRTPVREALLVLESRGLVDVRPRKGVRIRPISASDMSEIYAVLTALESLAARDAAGAGLSEAELQVLTECVVQMDMALANDDLLGWSVADHAFHAELVRLGGNSRVQAIVGMMSDQVKRARLVTLNMRPKPTQSNADHRALVDYIRDGDAQAAYQLHQSHCDRARTLMIELLKTYNLSSV